MGDIDVIRAIERSPLRTVRAQQLATITSNPARTISRLVAHGAVIKLATGVYTAPPDGRDARTWRPTLEAAALAVATARFGNRRVVLMGLGAGRHWAVIPRAIGVTTVAVPLAGRPPVDLEQGGVAHFIARDIDRIDASLEPTELGRALVTTPAQTLYDLLMKPRQGGHPQIAREAAFHLAAQVEIEDLHDVIARAGRANDALRRLVTDLERV